MSAIKTKTIDISSFCGLGEESFFSSICGLELKDKLLAQSVHAPELFDKFEGKILPFVAGKFGYLCEDGSLYLDDDIIWDSSFIGKKDARQIAVLGDWVCVFPDKVFYNTRTGHSGKMEESATLTSGNLSVTFADKGIPSAYYYSTVEPQNPPTDAIWVQKDVMLGTYRVYRRGESSSDWDEQETIFWRIGFSGADRRFSIGQMVSVSGLFADGMSFPFFDGIYRVGGVSDTHIYLEKKPDKTVLPRICRANPHHLVISHIKIEREVPTLTNIVTCAGRIWGVDSMGQIRACALGDIFSWQTEECEGDDAVTLPPLTTTAIKYATTVSDTPVFASEGEIIRVVGSRADNYSLVKTRVDGLCGLCQVGDRLYWADIYGKINYFCGTTVKTFSLPEGEIDYVIAFANKIYFVGKSGTNILDIAQNTIVSSQIRPQYILNVGKHTYIVEYANGKSVVYRGEGEAYTEWSMLSCAQPCPTGYTPSRLVLDIEGEGEVSLATIYNFTMGEHHKIFLGKRRKIRVPLGRENVDFVSFILCGKSRVALRGVSYEFAAD